VANSEVSASHYSPPFDPFILNYLTRFTNLSAKIPANLRSVWRWLPGPLAAMMAIGLVKLGASQPIEDFAYNRLTELRGERAWDDRVVVVEIDDPSIAEFKDLLTNRAHYTKLIDILRISNASTIVFDRIFSEVTPADDEFVKAIAKHKAVILAQGWDREGNQILPTRRLKAAAQAIGHIDKIKSHDGVVRQIQLYKKGVESLAWMAVEGHNLSNYPEIKRPPADRNFWISWPGRVINANHYSFGAILNPKNEKDKKRLEKGFNNKIILVGVTANGANRIDTPFDRSDEASSIYLHAAIVNNLLQHVQLNVLPNSWLFLVLLGVSPLLSYQLTRLTHGQRLVAMLGLSGGWIGTSTVALASNYWLPVSAPIALLLLTTIGVAYCERQYTDFLVKRQIDQLWQTYQINLVARTPQAIDNQLFSPIPVGKVAKLATLAAELGRAQSAQAAIAHSLSMGLVATELDGTVWFCNPVASQLLNVNIGNRIDQYLIPSWLTPQEWEDHLQDLQTCRSLPAKEVKRNDKFFTIKLEPLFNWQEIQRDIIDGKNIEEISVVSGFLLVIEDITAAKQLQSLLLDRERHSRQELTKENIALDKARQLAESAGKMKSAFLANMSHEIRTPMNAIVGLTDLLLTTKLNDLQQDFVETIRSSSDTLLTIINEILDFSKIEAGEMHLEKVNFNLATCVERIIEVLANNAYSKGIELSCRIDPNIPNYLQGDPTRLSQVLTNLIGNAIKFTDRGGVSIDISAIATTDRQTTLYFQVQDTGIGIEPDSQDKIFHSFSQADSSTTRQYGGTGLGLAISKRLIEMMGGEIGVISAPDAGSSFWFTLTCTRASTADSNELAIGQKLTRAIQGQRLLIAGTWEHSRRAIAAVAEHYGAIVTTTATSTTALNLLRAAAGVGESFQMLITDLVFADSPHTTLPEQITHYPELADLRTIATITYHECDRAKVLQERSIVTSYAFKPAKPLSLLNKLVEPSGLISDCNDRQVGLISALPHSRPLLPQQIGSNLKILVAEDNKINQKVALNQLKNLGYEADLACDGEEVLTQITDRHYDAILMDCHMPRLDGYATTREIRLREGDTRHTIIIALTASAMKEDLELAMAAGMDDFLSKPVRKEELAAKIMQWTNQPPVVTPPTATNLQPPNCWSPTTATDLPDWRTSIISPTPRSGRGSNPLDEGTHFAQNLPQPMPPTENAPRWQPSPPFAWGQGSSNYDLQPETRLRQITAARSQSRPLGLDRSAASDRVDTVDLEYLHQLSEGDTEFERTILQIFVENTHEQLQLIRTAVADRDLGTVQYRIHEIKGASANVGAIAIEQLAMQLERLVASGNILPPQSEIDPLLSEIEHLTQSIGLMNKPVSRD
jgi:signal transduction histidine kinase/CHASE2 domain-containing sensor protein/DNA-binding NarL/FixJ family response regulator/HPt (histidine-containing phosphotransfer) domain-containing protein